jgi:hypothetical protein
MTKSPRRTLSSRASSLAVSLTLSISSVAAAAPSEVVRNADARSAPFTVAPVVGSVTVGERVDADEQPSNGWRRVHLPNGKTGFVPDDSVKVVAPKVAAATSASGTASAPLGPVGAGAVVEPLAGPSGAGRPPVYVGDFSHLSSLVKSDPEVLSLAEGIAYRQTGSSIAIWGGVFGGIALWILAGTAFKKKDCSGGFCVEGTNATVHDLGTTILILGPLVGWAIRPTTWDRTDVVNAWNAKHPERPFVDRSGVTAP